MRKEQVKHVKLDFQVRRLRTIKETYLSYEENL